MARCVTVSKQTSRAQNSPADSKADIFRHPPYYEVDQNTKRIETTPAPHRIAAFPNSLIRLDRSEHEHAQHMSSNSPGYILVHYVNKGVNSSPTMPEFRRNIRVIKHLNPTSSPHGVFSLECVPGTIPGNTRKYRATTTATRTLAGRRTGSRNGNMAEIVSAKTTWSYVSCVSFEVSFRSGQLAH